MHYGEEDYDDKYHAAVIPPIAATSLHVFKDVESYLGKYSEPSESTQPCKRYTYGRSGNPTVALLEKKLAALERAGGALCFGSGMAAITSAVMHCVKPGDHIVSVYNAYGVTTNFFNNRLSKWGVKTDYVRGCDPSEFEKAIKPETSMFYLESPSGAVMDIQDLAAIAGIAKSLNIKTVIDNTCATPLYQNPIVSGVDIVLHTMSKYIGGHSDIIGGVLCSDADTIHEINNAGRQLDGGILSPFEAWLCLRGLRTLPLRVKKSGENAMAVAKLLESSAKVRKVYYPGLETHPQSELASRQMSGFSGLLSFEPAMTMEQCIKFGNALKIYQTGVSWGGFESLFGMWQHEPYDAKVTGSGEKHWMIRLYCGLENTQELLDDVSMALDGV